MVGFTFTWMTKKGKKSFEDVSYTVVDRKRQEIKRKGYKVSPIVQCIF